MKENGKIAKTSYILEILQNIAQNIIETQVIIQIENKILLLISNYIACSLLY